MQTLTNARFDYPTWLVCEYPALRQRTGQTVTVVRALTGVDGLLYLIKFPDGYEDAAYPEELTVIQEEDNADPNP